MRRISAYLEEFNGGAVLKNVEWGRGTIPLLAFDLMGGRYGAKLPLGTQSTDVGSRVWATRVRLIWIRPS